MILADKLIYLRKKHGMTQEELAVRLNISRQSVSKWESAQAMPDIDKIVELSKIFNVTTDALIKDELELDTSDTESTPQAKRHVTYETAVDYLKLKFRAAYLIAIATFIIILSPGVMLIIMSLPMRSEPLACGLGLTALFVLVALSVCIYIYSYFKTSGYEYISKENFSLDFSTVDMLIKTEKKLWRVRVIMNILATALCILSALPLILTALSPSASTLAIMIALTATLFIVGVGVMLFIISGVKHSAISELKETKSTRTVCTNKLQDSIESAFWTLTTAIYLLYSFTSGNWHLSWIIFIFASAISCIISALFASARRAKDNDNSDDSNKE